MNHIIIIIVIAFTYKYIFDNKMAGLPSVKLSSGQVMPQLGLGYVKYYFMSGSLLSRGTEHTLPTKKE